LHDLLAGLDAEFEVRGDRAVEIRSLEHDSRVVQPGALFCCIPGEQADGHAFAGDAVAAGAVACLVERWLDVPVVQVRVASVRTAVGPLCATFFGRPADAMRVLGVTGTNGKTTTTYLLEAIARGTGERAAIVGTTGVRVGDTELPVAHTTPEATELQALLARLRDDGVATVAMEVSSHALDQHRVDGTHFAAVAFTNLSRDHLDYHRSFAAYLDAKARLFDGSFSRRAAVGIDGEAGRVIASRARAAGVDVVTYALDAGADADVTAREIELAPDGARYTIADRRGENRYTLRTALVGRFNVANALAAYATATQAGFAAADACDALTSPIVVPGRMESIDRGQPFTVIVDYAHTPDALSAVLAAARDLTEPGGRLLVVYGCGGDRDRGKRPEMGAVAAHAADRAFLTSDNPRSEDPAAIVHDVLAGVADDAPTPVVELDRRAAIEAALADARPGDVVVIAGKGHESGQTALGRTIPFDDRVVAREALEARV
jgi:UDP-N-acetylmuramoyl-L-alanyl-D-glutamate--2,6-diaminopimelate ligase